MSKALRFSAVLAAAVCLGAAAPPTVLEPSRLAGFVDLYIPAGKGKDYELRLAAYRGEATRAEWIVRRHGQWARVERRDGGVLTVQQVHIPTGVVIERADKSAAGVETLSIRSPDVAPTPGIDYASRPTKQSWKAAGQKCRIWEVYRGVDAGYTTFTRFGCITRDGIEVARWTTGRTGADLGERATGYYLWRGKVAEADVRPSGTSLDVSTWIGARPGDAGADREVVLKAEDGSEAVTLRRHGGWSFAETVNADGSRDIFSDREDGATVSARIGAGGGPQSYIARRGPRPEVSPKVRLDQPAQTVLGQTCNWYDVMPNVADAGRHECRTADDTVLAIRKFSRGGDLVLTATEVNRRPLTDADILPPAWLLDLRRWGVTD